MTPFDQTICQLGEGPVWHPLRKELFWFDILDKRMFCKGADTSRDWQFDEHFSAAGWVDAETLLLASETALWRFEIETGERSQLCPLEADNAATRSNDGRADRWGGFWIGTMGKSAEPKAGAIYRYFQGELRQIVPDITISNAICFAPDRSRAYYTDTVTQVINVQPLRAEDGWPDGPPSAFVDLKANRLNPDGAVTDASGNLWVAMWGASCVVCFDPSGQELQRVPLPARQITCPAWGGPDFTDLYVTSASHGLYEKEIAARPLNGATFLIPDAGQGRAEPRVVL